MKVTLEFDLSALDVNQKDAFTALTTGVSIVRPVMEHQKGETEPEEAKPAAKAPAKKAPAKPKAPEPEPEETEEEETAGKPSVTHDEVRKLAGKLVRADENNRAILQKEMSKDKYGNAATTAELEPQYWDSFHAFMSELDGEEV